MQSRFTPYKGKWPQVDNSVFVAEGARVLGDVTIEQGASIWCNTVIRGDESKIHIGRCTNIQDNSTVHGNCSCTVGDYVTVGHNVLLHGCTVGNNCIIGMGAILLNGVVIGENCIVGAGSLVPENKVIPPNSLIVGSPARVIRTLSLKDTEMIRKSATHYREVAEEYMNYATDSQK